MKLRKQAVPALLLCAITAYGQGTPSREYVYLGGRMVAAEYLPIAVISLTHTGSFSQSQNGAAYWLNVTNPAGSPATSGAVTVSELLPAGLTLASMAGAGWSCAGTICSRGDSLSSGASYPPITVTVNVSSAAPSTLVNQASVSGGGLPASTASDSTAIQVPFGDSASDPFIEAINLMREYSVTAGCSASPPLYCPTQNVTRGQMAIFIVRAIMGNESRISNSRPPLGDSEIRWRS